jgi:hypothetical protein
MVRVNQPRLILAAQRLMIRTSEGPLRHAWRAAYGAAARAWAFWLRGASGATVYLRRSLGARSVRYGISDIDLVIVVADDPRGPGHARQRVVARQAVLERWLPVLAGRLLDRPMVLEEGDLVRVAQASSGSMRREVSIFFGPGAHQDRIALWDQPGLRGPTGDWRRISGPARTLAQPVLDRSRLRVAAWRELQALWRLVLQDCAAPAREHTAHFCVKLVAEPLRIWLALCLGEYPRTHHEVLQRALHLLPQEEEMIRRALWLERRLAERPQPSLGDFLPALVRLSDRIAGAMTAEIEPAGAVAVRLDWRESDPLVDESSARRLVAPDARPSVLPLADWRAMVRAGVHWQGRVLTDPPDETLAPVDLDPGRLSDLVAAVGHGSHGPYPALRAGGLLVLASRRWPRTHLRAVQCRITDPVSFALLEGRSSAPVPEVTGWSVGDTAARAVAEHRAWLAHPEAVVGGEALSMVISAARAALLAETLEAGTATLTPTVLATLRGLRARDGGATLIDDVEEAYRRWRADGSTPEARLVAAAATAVQGLDSYRRG